MNYNTGTFAGNVMFTTCVFHEPMGFLRINVLVLALNTNT